MYVCGPTVYGDAHIGNARPIIVFDTLRKTFEELKYKVEYLSNYTDVDDKIIQKALDEKVDEIYDLKKLRFQISEAHNLYEIIEGLWNSDMAEEFEDKKQELEDKIDELEDEIEELEQDIEDIKEGSDSEWQNREYESQLL
jgi:cysteinyl-tRNA synthetase